LPLTRSFRGSTAPHTLASSWGSPAPVDRRQYVTMAWREEEGASPGQKY